MVSCEKLQAVKECCRGRRSAGGKLDGACDSLDGGDS